MRIVFIGASKFGLKCLKVVANMHACSIVGVVTAPQNFSISYNSKGVNNVLFADIKDYCQTQDIDCVVMERNMKDKSLYEHVRAWEPDMFFIVGWYHMVPTSWRDLAPVYGMHASLLPDYSGGAPLVWAMINGEPRTGITLFQFADGVDNGPIVGQLATDITSEDTIASLYERIEGLGIELICGYLPLLVDGTAELMPQDEAKRRLFPQRSPEDGKITWSHPVRQVHNFIRAQTKPYPGAFTSYGQDKITIWQSRIVDCSKVGFLSPGEIKEENEQVYVGCGNGTVLEITHIANNGIDIPANSWWRTQPRSRDVYTFS